MKDLYKSHHRMKLNHFIFLGLSNEMKNKYCCAEIIKDNKLMCYILPSVWLNNDKKTVKWPATESVKMIDKLFTDCASQFEFNILQIEKLHCYNTTYDEALAMYESVPKYGSRKFNLAMTYLKASTKDNHKSLKTGLI